MIEDARRIVTGARLETDVCIIGGGPVGIALALELAGPGRRVLLLESGGLTSERRTQDLGKGSIAGLTYEPLHATRVRALGGTALAWTEATQHSPAGGLRNRPLDPIDFSSRSWLPHSGWPFDFDHLRPYYLQAHQFCGLADFNYEPDQLDGEQFGRPLPLSGDRVQTTLFRFSGRDAILAHRNVLIESSAVRVVHHATVTALEAQDSPQAVSAARVAAGSVIFSVSATIFVLASGGIENARLLLLSNQSQPGGLGNGNDLVGRFFMEHLTLRPAFIRLQPSFLDKMGLYRRHQVGNLTVLAALCLSPAVREQEQLLGVILAPDLGPSLDFWGFSFLQGEPRLPGPRNWARHIGQAIQRRLTRMGRGPLDFRLHLHFEQAPRAENRVMLGDGRDSLGQRQILLRWRVGEQAERSLLRSLQLASQELTAAGLGTVDVPLRPGDFASQIEISHHHMGTTRMHRDPLHGVVDENARVHGMQNLFITGSSVMPTSGAATVTLSAIALGLRLAEHLKRRLDQIPSID